MTNTSASHAREAIQAGNVLWGAARVALDRAAFERMLAPGFQVFLRGRRLGRREFIDEVARHPPNRRLTRFEATVLTVQPSSDDWAAIILEKLEYRRASTGTTDFVLAITRDRWRRSAEGWEVHSSELIGEERWCDGERPPMADW
jgi:hypothetical protein